MSFSSYILQLQLILANLPFFLSEKNNNQKIKLKNDNKKGSDVPIVTSDMQAPQSILQY